MLFLALVRLYASVFEAGGVPLDDTPLEVVHTSCLLTTLACVAPLLGAHVAMGAASAWWAVAIAFDVVAIVYAVVVIALPRRGDRRTLYAATTVVSALTVLVTAWVHGPGHIVHFYAVIVIAMGHILHVPSPLLWAIHGGYLAVIVAQSCDLAWAAFGYRPTATHVDRVLLGRGFVFLWHLLGNIGVAVGIQFCISAMFAIMSQQREGGKADLQECEKLGKILETKEVTHLEEALERLPGSGCKLTFHVQKLCHALLRYRAFLPDNYDVLNGFCEKEDLDDSSFNSSGPRTPFSLSRSTLDMDDGVSPHLTPRQSFKDHSSRGSNASTISRATLNQSSTTLNESKRTSSSSSTTSSKCNSLPAVHAMESINTVVLTAENTSTSLDDTFLSVLVAEVKNRNGVVHSYRGGILVVTWAKSKRVPRPHVNAIRAAVNASQVLPHCRMGLDVSQCLVGTIGDPALNFFNELCGPAVEGSLVLCTLCGVLDAKILVSDSIRGEVQFACLSRLVGFTSCTDVREGPPTLTSGGVGIGVFEILDLRSSEKDKVGEASLEEWQYLLQADDRMQEEVAHFERGVAAYAAGHMEEALDILHDVLEANPQDRVAAAFVRGF